MDVLLVDDDERLRTTLRRLLRRVGFDDSLIAEACDGTDALRQLGLLTASDWPRLIITDCQMPNMDGIRLTKALRAAGVSIPILMISGVEDRTVIAAALTAGVNRFIPKPAAMEELESALTSLLGRVPNAA